jgi:hypothetical protein
MKSQIAIVAAALAALSATPMIVAAADAPAATPPYAASAPAAKGDASTTKPTMHKKRHSHKKAKTADSSATTSK